ncbi:MAG: alanine racemase [Lachnospiraceae bacterium]|nr:alanine racemase [Lachnospiraceae bacterium]
MIQYDRTKLVINLDNIRYNVSELKKKVDPASRLMFVIKADGYGHGAVRIMQYLGDSVDAYGVAVINEAVALRENGCKKLILILGYTPKSCLTHVVSYNISQTVTDYETARLISEEAVRQGVNAKIHIKIDTGMGRIGFMPGDDSVAIIRKISELPNIVMEGCFTHFSKADEKDLSYTERQYAIYIDMIERLKEAGVTFAIKHACNSAAVIQFPKADLDMVRLGIASYGLYPSEEIDRSVIELKPAMEWKTIISYVKTVQPGTRISYGGTYTADSVRRIATVPVGYADGYPRALSNCGRVIVNGMSAPIVGRVCMDQFMIDVTDIPDVKVEDSVTLVGRDGGEWISVEEIAAYSNSFNYEVICDVGKRVPREYICDSHI